MKRLIIKPATRAERAVSIRITRNGLLVGPRDCTSYAVGLHVARRLHGLPFDFNPQTLLAGLRDGFAGAQPLLSEAERRDLFLRFQQELIAQARARRCEMSAANRSAGAAFWRRTKTGKGFKCCRAVCSIACWWKVSGLFPR